MTTETTTKTEEEDLEKPFSAQEVAWLLFRILTFYPIGLGCVFALGAYFHSYPQFPTPWYGFYVAVLGIPTIALCCMVLLLDSPRLVRQRASKIMPTVRESRAERLFHKTVAPIFTVALLGGGYEGSMRRETFPHWLNWAALSAFVVAYLWIVWVMKTNKYAARVVFKQKGQQLITTGPYAVVRHPMYLGMVPLFLSLPLAVGSFWPLIPMGICLILVAIRTNSEEEFLINEFGDEYREFQKKTRYRMIPLIF